MAVRVIFNIVHNHVVQRFEVIIEGCLAVLEYRLGPGVIIFTHTGVPDPISHRGVGASLAKEGLDYARTAGKKVVPLCPFITTFIQEHSEILDLLTYEGPPD